MGCLSNNMMSERHVNNAKGRLKEKKKKTADIKMKRTMKEMQKRIKVKLGESMGIVHHRIEFSGSKIHSTGKRRQEEKKSVYL